MVLAQTLAVDTQGQPLIQPDGLGLPQIEVRVTTSNDNIEVTGHCLTDSARAPSANATCFSEARNWQVRIGPPWHLWARDAAGNVSAGALSPGPCSAAAYAASSASSLPTVCILTDQGEVVVELEDQKAPATVRNFLSYVHEGFYAGTVFHRVLAGSVLQGGGFTSLADVPANQAKASSRSPIALERTTVTGLSNQERTLAMARANAPDSATSQFFINLRNNASIYDTTDGSDGYAVFGRVIHGYEPVVRPIASVPLGGRDGDLPQRAIFIQWAYAMK